MLFMKRILKIFGVFLLVIVIALVSIPWLLHGTIEENVRKIINDAVVAKVDFLDVHANIFRNFPNASLVIDEFSIINEAPFEGDTLVFVKKIALTVAFTDLFKSGAEGYKIKKIQIDKADIAVKIDTLGRANYDIAKSSESSSQVQEDEVDSGDPIMVALEHYELNNSKILFKDDQNHIEFILHHLNHSGDGVVSGEKIILDTHSDSQTSFKLQDTEYFNKTKLLLDAKLALDLKTQKYTFMENKAQINELPLAFDGYVQLFDKYTDVNVHFKTPNSDFKNFLGVIPKSYTNSIKDVQTSGDFKIDGIVNGKVDDKHIPTLNISLQSKKSIF